MVRKAQIQARSYRSYAQKDIDSIPQLESLPAEERLAMKAVASVLPFRVNNYVLDELIDWDRVPDDPMFQLTFPQRGMLDPDDFATMAGLIRRNAPDADVQAAARQIQLRMNPHPAGQMKLNVPRLHGDSIDGMQHKYRETVLFFPTQGQTCHAYCTYCFRWAQFVGIDELKFANRDAELLAAYVRKHSEVHSVLFTGGDPLIMKTRLLRRYIEPLLASDLEHLVSIRLGTKATAYWPYRFLTDSDADDLMRLFREVVAAGKHLAIMSHFSHPREMETPEAQAAIRRIHGTGAVVRCQAPLVRRVNDSADTWAAMWRMQVRLGAVPYYMFVERDTGPKNYFEVPLARAHDIFRKAYRRVSGLSRTVRGPSMSATPGKVVVNGVANIHGKDVFALEFIQARDPEWVGRPFFAKFNPTASWLDDLEPAFGEDRFFFEDAMLQMEQSVDRKPAWADRVVKRRMSPIFHLVEPH